MTFVLDRLLSPTWPLEVPYDGLPSSLFCDANIIGADAFHLTSVLIGSGNIHVQGTAYLGNEETALHSDAVTLARGMKMLLYTDDGECRGWLMTGEAALPETLILDGVDIPLCQTVCTPYTGVEPENQSGMTGDWTVEGRNGVKVGHSVDGDELTLAFDADEDYFDVESGDDVDYNNGIGIYSVNGVGGPLVPFQLLVNGGIFPVLDGGRIRDILLIPDMLFEYPYASTPGGDLHIRTVVFTYPSLNNDENNIMWVAPDYGSLTYANGVFTVTSLTGYNGTVKVNAAINGLYGPTLFINWPSCDRVDYIRSIIKTSTEDGSSEPYPLDDILRDDGSNP